MSLPTFMPTPPLTCFPAIYLSNFSLSFIHFPSPESFSQCWAYFFSHFFGHLVSLPQMSLPKSSSRLANSCCTIAQRAKELRESMNPYCSGSENWLRFRNIFTYSQSQCPTTGKRLIHDVFNIGIPILGTIIGALPNIFLSKTETSIKRNSSFLIKAT